MKLITLACLSFFITSSTLWAQSIEEREGLLRDFLLKHPWGIEGKREAAWLLKRSGSEWHKVAVFFGFGINFDACLEIAAGLNSQFPQHQYSCDTVDREK